MSALISHLSSPSYFTSRRQIGAVLMAILIVAWCRFGPTLEAAEFLVRSVRAGFVPAPIFTLVGGNVYPGVIWYLRLMASALMIIVGEIVLGRPFGRRP